MSQLKQNKFVNHDNRHCTAVEINGKSTPIGNDTDQRLREELAKSVPKRRVARMEYKKFIQLMSLGH
jgi:hypothetical protein